MRYRSIACIHRSDLAGVLAAVARDVDHLPPADKGLLSEQVLGGGDAAARISQGMHPGPACAAQAGRQSLEVIPPVKDGPGHQDALLLRTQAFNLQLNHLRQSVGDTGFYLLKGRTVLPSGHAARSLAHQKALRNQMLQNGNHEQWIALRVLVHKTELRPGHGGSSRP